MIKNVTSWFSLTTPNECPIIKYELWGSTRLSPQNQGPQVWQNFIILNAEDIQINHNNIFTETIKNNTLFRVYVTAVTFGNIIGQREIQFTIIYPPINHPPKFDTEPTKWVIKIFGEEQWAGYDKPIITFELPAISDPEGDKYTIQTAIEQSNCECIKIHHT